METKIRNIKIEFSEEDLTFIYSCVRHYRTFDHASLAVLKNPNPGIKKMYEAEMDQCIEIEKKLLEKIK